MIPATTMKNGEHSVAFKSQLKDRIVQSDLRVKPLVKRISQIPVRCFFRLFMCGSRGHARVMYWGFDQILAHYLLPKG